MEIDVVPVAHASPVSAVSSAAGPRALLAADLNTPETTGSGLLDGMVLATITGRCWRRLRSTIPGYRPVDDSAILLVGVRELDPGEASLLEDLAIARVSPGATRARRHAALARLAERVDGVYAHFDLDVLDASVGRANAFASAGGLSGAELSRWLADVEQTCGIGALTLASYDPVADRGGGICDVALEAVEAAWGGE